MRKLLDFGFYGMLLGLLVMAGFSAQSGGPRQGPPPSVQARGPVDAGMVALVALPEKYEGKFVRTHGFLCVEFEGDALYLHEEDYRHRLTKNSLALRLSDPQRQEFKAMNLRYVLVEGTVYARGPESRDRWSGAIGKVTRLEAWPW